MILELVGAAAEGGRGFTIYAIKGLRARIDELPEEEADVVYALFEEVTERDLPKNRKKCNRLGDSIFELKPGQLRFPFFYDHQRRRVIVLTHYFKKQSQETPPREIEHARQVRSRFLDAVRNGTVKYDDVVADNAT